MAPKNQNTAMQKATSTELQQIPKEKMDQLDHLAHGLKEMTFRKR